MVDDFLKKKLKRENGLLWTRVDGGGHGGMECLLGEKSFSRFRSVVSFLAAVIWMVTIERNGVLEQNSASFRRKL